MRPGTTPWKQRRRCISVSRSEFAERNSVEQACGNVRVGDLDQALHQANFDDGHGLDGLLGVAAKQEIQLLAAAMGCPVKGAAAAHGKIVVRHRARLERSGLGPVKFGRTFLATCHARESGHPVAAGARESFKGGDYWIVRTIKLVLGLVEPGPSAGR